MTGLEPRRNLRGIRTGRKRHRGTESDNRRNDSQRVLALMLAFGQQRFVAGPVMILTELIAECSLERFFLYLVIARGDIDGFLAFVKILRK